jgi:hypothetical protein
VEGVAIASNLYLYWNNQTKDDEMSRKCRMHGGPRNMLQILVGKPKGRPLGELGTGERILLN